MGQKLTKKEFNNTIGIKIKCPICELYQKVIKVNNNLLSINCLHWEGELNE